MKKLSKDERGIAQIVLIVVALVVVAGIGFAAWRILGNKKSTNSASNATPATIAANKEAEDACNKLYNDKDLCKFASNVNLTSASYKATFTSTDTAGKVTSFEISQDGKGNSSTLSKSGSSEATAFIMLNGDSYIKDPTDGSWTKYAKSTSTPNETKPTDNLKVDFKDEESKPVAQRVTYKKIGKEKCGNDTCFKYQIVDPSNANVTESIIWFGDKDYVLRKWSSKNDDGSTSVGEFTYTSVNITAPSPIKEAPKVPTQAEIQQQIQDAQNAQ